MKDEASYICDSCGGGIVLPIDLLSWPAQEYVADGSVCCRGKALLPGTGVATR
jgi:hypothetical protein